MTINIKEKKKMIVLLLVLEFIYVIFELALNAAIVNMAVGLTVSPDLIDKVELAGRTLSGIGLGLAVYNLITINGNVKNGIIVLGLSILVSIPVMHKLQTIIVDKIIVANSSPELRARSELLLEYRNGMLLSLYGVGNEIPFDLKNTTNPNELTFLSLFPLIMSESSVVERELRKDYKWYEDSLVEQAKLSTFDYYSGYLEISKPLAEFHKIINKSYNPKIKLNAGKSKIDAAYIKLLSEFENEAYQIYLDYDMFSYSVERDVMARYRYNQAEAEKSFRDIKYCRVKDSSCIAIIHSKRLMSNYFRDNSLRDLSYTYWCDGGKCPGDISYVYSQILKRNMKLFLKKSGGFPPGLKMPSDIAQSKVFFDKSIGKLRDKTGMPNLLINYESYGKNNSNLRKSFFLEAALTFAKERDLDIVGLNKPISKNDFINRDEVKDIYKKLMGDFYFKISSFDMNESQFTKKFMVEFYRGNLKKRADFIKNNIKGFSKDGDREADGELYAKMLFVPPVALVFSLFFGLLTLCRLPKKILEIIWCGKVNKSKAFMLSAMPLVSIAVILLVPMFHMGSKFTSESSMNRLNELHGSELAGVKKHYIEWVLKTQPVIYPIGNALLSKVGHSNIDHPKFSK